MPSTVYAFGSNGAGQLAIGHSTDVSIPTKCLFHDDEPPSDAIPVSIAAGGNHTLLRYSNGAVYAAGQNNDGRCGLPALSLQEANEEADIMETCFTTFRRVRFTSRLGDSIEIFDDICATWSASFFLAANGLVYAAGTGFKGELGLGSVAASSAETTYGRSLVTSAPNPAEVAIQALGDERVTQLVSGVNHVIAISRSGFYGWGSARHGELGQQQGAMISIPCILPDFPSAKGAVIACGLNFSYALFPDDDGKQILLGPSARHLLRVNLPKRLPDEDWVSVSASWNTIYLTNRHGCVLSWGRGERGQLPPKQLANGKVGGGTEKLVAGSEHVLALGMDGKVRVWGWGEHGNCGPERAARNSKEGVDEVADHRDEDDHDWTDISVANAASCRPLGAGCATSWLIVDQ